MLALHLHKSLTETITCTPQIVIYAVVEKGMGNNGKLWLNHDTSIGSAVVGKKAQSDVVQQGNKPVAIAIIKLYLSEGHWLVSK